MIITLGTGVLNWDRNERVTDRYGAVHLSFDTDSDEPLSLNRQGGRQRGKLFALIIEARDSTHIGDLFRGLFPETPKVGERIELGEGTLFFDGKRVGLQPADGREDDWLNPQALYRCHEQTVELQFEPQEAGQ